jgi:phosphoribosylaminoimidazolecarboxamide formyltransferase/IMP cyclohydrolase
MPDNGRIKIRRALISVSDKTDLEQLARDLNTLGIEIISTGGTLNTIQAAGVPAIGISDYTGSPEILGGRVKTLHPKVYAGILYRRDNEDDTGELSQVDADGIDLVIVNLYPFQKTLANPDATDAELIEKIDIGGPTLLRATAKNADFVTVVTSPADYTELINLMKANDGATTLEFRRECARKAFALTRNYDIAISAYYERLTGLQRDFPPQVHQPVYRLVGTTRYGQNPHQLGALYALAGHQGPSLVNAIVRAENKLLSFNNYQDGDAVLNMLLDFDQPFACLFKHRNPCGAAVGSTIAEAYAAALATDPLSAFGCIIGLNRTVDLECAQLIHDTQFVECIIAPGYTDEALALLTKKKQRRILELPSITQGWPANHLVEKPIHGGTLLELSDDAVITEAMLKVVTKRSPSPEEITSLLFAWKVAKHTISNAIILAKGTAAIGIGMGQTSRVDSGFMAVKRAGERTKGAVCASDAFFPMPDGVAVCAQAGITAFIQPGGSKGDEAAIEAADRADAAMVFTGYRCFKH